MKVDVLDRMIAWEEGKLNGGAVVKLFQELIDNDYVWTLQGSYGRTAAALITSGLCHRKKEE